jgi:hypothetical protein
MTVTDRMTVTYRLEIKSHAFAGVFPSSALRVLMVAGAFK